MSFADGGRSSQTATPLEQLSSDIQSFVQLVNRLEWLLRNTRNGDDLIILGDEQLSKIKEGIQLQGNGPQVTKLKHLVETQLVPKFIKLKEIHFDENTPLLSEGDGQDDKEDHGQAKDRENNRQLVVQEVKIQPEGISDHQLTYHSDLIESRFQSIDQIQQGVNDINQIYKALDRIVDQQGETLDTIGDNIWSYSRDTQLAMGELNRADEYQRKKGKWCFMILVALLILVAVLAVLVS